MDITKILSDLGLDFSNPDTKRGALEAINAILGSRNPMSGGLGGPAGGTEVDVEVDPDLIQPSTKSQPSEPDGTDIEINDEEDLLKQVKQNESDFDDNEEAPSDEQGSHTDSKNSTGNDSDTSSDTTDTNEKNDSTKDEKTSTNEDDETTDDSDETDNIDDEESVSSRKDDTEEPSDELDDTNEIDELDNTDETDTDEEPEDLDFEPDETDTDSTDFDEFDDTGSENVDEDEIEDSEEEDSEDENYFDDADVFKDEEIKKKEDARKIKRERTLAAAKKALAEAQARKVSQVLIQELEKAIAALEALTEAVKSIKDISDKEFNSLINRVFDAIDAVGDKSLTFSSEEERAAKAKEIKTDLASEKTRDELSAEDIAKIRAENQAIQAREKEINKYRARSRGSFKGFQEFLNSLYRAIALQVATEETRDDSWSAISRRNSGAGVLQQGKRIQDLNNKKIPVIDFYFDQSGSWDEADIKVGEKAVQCLADMEAEGKIKINIYYFSTDVFTDAASARARGGTSGWNEIVKNVISTQATNVIIMTDSDMENWWIPQNKPPLTYTVPGYVWYLWRYGDNAPRLPRDLKGRGGTQQFSFSGSDM